MLSTFNLILAFMTTMDTLFLVLSIIEYSLVQAFHCKSRAYDRFFVYFLYPVHNITLISSVFSHVVLAFERYLAVCHPMEAYGRAARDPKKMSAGTSKAIRKKARKINSTANLNRVQCTMVEEVPQKQTSFCMIFGVIC